MLNRLITTDPGRLRLKLAIRTTLSSIIAGAICSIISPFCVIVGVLSGMFTQMAIHGYNAKEKLSHSLLMLVTFSACFALSALCKHTLILSDTLLVIGAFASFYFKRFGPRYTLFPLFSWVFIYLASIFTIPFSTNILGTAGAAIGAIVAGIVSITILPERKLKLFVDQVGRHFELGYQTLKWLRTHIRKPTTMKEYTRLLRPRRLEVIKILTDNQTIVSDYTLKNEKYSSYLEAFMLHEYSLSKAMNILIDALKEIFFSATKTEHSEKLTQHLCRLIAGLATSVRKLSINDDLSLNFPKHLPNIPAELDAFKKTLTEKTLEDEPDIIHFYNCYTSIERYWHNLNALGQLRENRN